MFTPAQSERKAMVEILGFKYREHCATPNDRNVTWLRALPAVK